MTELANGNSFSLSGNSNFGVVNMPLEGALALGPSLHLFDVSPFRRPGNAL
jgi:hypothetical protein